MAIDLKPCTFTVLLFSALAVGFVLGVLGVGAGYLIFQQHTAVPQFANLLHNETQIEFPYQNVSQIEEEPVRPSNVTADNMLRDAVINGNEKLIEELIENGANCSKPIDVAGKTPIHISAQMGNENILNLLLQHGVDVNLKDLTGRTPLFEAADAGHENIVLFLANHGANLDNKDTNGNFALGLAAYRGKTRTVATLLANGAYVNQTDAKGETALHRATFSKSIGAMKVLLENKIDVNRKSFIYGVPALAYAGERDDIVKLLLSNGAHPDYIDLNGIPLLHHAAYFGFEKIVKILIANNATVNIKDRSNTTALHKAVYNAPNNVYTAGATLYKKDKYNITKYLLEHAANPNIQDNQGKTPLHSSIKDGYYVSQPKDKYDVVHLLLDNGAKINIQDNNGNTCMHLAIDDGDGKIVKLLIERGADVSIKNKDGFTPRDIAKKGHGDLIDILNTHVEIEDDIPNASHR